MALLRAAKKGNQEALETLLRHHIRYIIKIAREYGRMGLPEEDLIGEGLVGFLEAVYRYRPKFKSRFITYAYWWIRKNVLAALSRETNLVHVPYDRLQKLFQIQKVESYLTNSLGRRPTTENVADFLSIPVREVENIRKAMQFRTEFLEILNGHKRNGHRTPGNGSVVHTDPLYQWLNQESHSRIRLAVKKLPQREQWILTKRFGLTGGKSSTLLEIADKMGVSKERVRQLEGRAKQQVRRIYLKLEGQHVPKPL
jgi:RNA polymerase sigma factor (sigma-70 family)